MQLFASLLRTGKKAWLAALALCATAALHAQADGTQKWAYATMATALAGNMLSSPAVAPDGTIYVGIEIGASGGADSGQLFAINPDGSPKWNFPTPDWIDSTPAIGSDGTIYFGCWDGNLYALNPDGTKKWSLSVGAYVSASPAIGPDGTIYVGTGDGNFCAVNPDGTLKWLFPTLYWIDSAPAIAPDGTIYIGSEDNNFYAINPNGTLKWQYGTGNDIVSSPAIAADGTVYVGSRDLNLYAFAPDGTLKWKFGTADMIEASPVLAADGTIYFATTGGRVYALNRDGTQKWEYPDASQPALNGIYSTPAVRADGSLVFGSSDNAVFALSANGTLLWKAPVGDWADSSPCVALDGTIYIGCTDRKLYAFNGSSPLTMTDWPQLLRNPQRTGYQPLGAATGTTGQLMNLSVRTLALTGSQSLIAGFYIGGSGSRNLLIRGTGPALTTFGVTGVLADPQIAFYPSGSGSPTLTNNNWSDATNASAIASTGNAVGAFPLQSGSLDSAMLSSFPAGGGSVQISGHDGGTGIALVELYDAGGSSTAELTNLSARSYVGTGGGVLIAGFVVDAGTRAVLIRAVGPTLAQPPFNMSGVIPNPKLQVFQSPGGHEVIIAENNGWTNTTNASAITAAGNSVSAFPLASGSADSAMLLTLPAGAYSCEMSGINGTTGVGMIEVYEIK